MIDLGGISVPKTILRSDSLKSKGFTYATLTGDDAAPTLGTYFRFKMISSSSLTSDSL